MDPDSTGFDPHRYTMGESIHRTYTGLREECPVAHSDRHGGFYILTRFTDVRRAAADHEALSSATGHMLPEPGWPLLPPIDFDPPQHTWWRHVFRELLSTQARRRLEAQVRATADRLIDGFAEDGACDLFSAYAEPIPVWTIAQLTGLDEEKTPALRRLALNLYAAVGDPGAFGDAYKAFVDFLMAEVADRRADPRDDYLTRLGTETFDGVRLTDDDLIGVFISIFVAGHHSTASALASLLCQVACDRGLRARLIADRGLVPKAAEEAIRLHTPLHSFRRVATRDITIGGTEIPAGADVLLVFAAANRDPRAFERAEEFSIDRRQNAHLAFGFGIHTCVGAPIARMELRVALNRLLDRLPDFHADVRPKHSLVGGKLEVIQSLPVHFTPKSVLN